MPNRPAPLNGVGLFHIVPAADFRQRGNALHLSLFARVLFDRAGTLTRSGFVIVGVILRQDGNPLGIAGQGSFNGQSRSRLLERNRQRKPEK
jgi:hypothetical protein